MYEQGISLIKLINFSTHMQETSDRVLKSIEILISITILKQLQKLFIALLIHRLTTVTSETLEGMFFQDYSANIQSTETLLHTRM